MHGHCEAPSLIAAKMQAAPGLSAPAVAPIAPAVAPIAAPIAAPAAPIAAPSMSWMPLAVITVVVLLAMNVVLYFPEWVFGSAVVARVDYKRGMKEKHQKRVAPDPVLPTAENEENVRPLKDTFGGRGLAVEKLQKSVHYMDDPMTWGTRHERGRWLLVQCRDWTGPTMCPFVRKIMTQLLDETVTDVRILLLQVMGPDAEAVRPWVAEHKDWFDPRNAVPSIALLVDGKPTKNKLGAFSSAEEAQAWIHED